MKNLVISFAFLFIGVFTFSQVTTSNIKGLVLDETGQPPLGVDTSGSEPVYTFNGGSDAETFGFDASLASRWQAQFGVRYIF